MTLEELEREHAEKEAVRKAYTPPLRALPAPIPIISYMCSSHNCNQCRLNICKCDCHQLEWMGMC